MLDRYGPIRFSSFDSDAERRGVLGSSRYSLYSESGRVARRYLHVNRGLDPGTIGLFRLGFVPFSSGHVLAGRVVIPIYDYADELLALSVRPIYKIVVKRDGTRFVAVGVEEKNDKLSFSMPNGASAIVDQEDVFEVDEPEQKYWNESFPKGEHLFGINLAKYAIAEHGFAILVEGQMDVISLYSNGVRNVVAIMGGELTPLHICSIFRWTNQVVLLMDGDDAGRRHCDKAMETISTFSRGHKKLNATSVRLPGKEVNDPDSYVVRYGAPPLAQTILRAMKSAGMSMPHEYPWSADAKAAA